MQNILVGIDFSELTRHLIDTAASLGQAYGSTVRLLHVAPPDPAFASSKGWPQEVRDEMAKELQTEHHQLQEYTGILEGRGLTAKAFLARGPIEEKLLEFAEETGTDLVILGSRKHGALGRLLPTSIVKDIVVKASCCVLVVPDRRK